MPINRIVVTETADAFIIGNMEVLKMKPRQANVYDLAIIKAIGVDLFFDLVAPKEPLSIPDLWFSEAEWDAMNEQP